MKHTASTVITSAFVLGTLSLVSQAETIVKLGFGSPLTGPQAHYGKDNLNGVQLAVEELNVKGLTIAGQKVKFQIVSEDDQADPRAGTQVAQKLVDQKVNAVLGHFNSGVTIPASKLYSEAGIPELAVATNPQYLKQGFKSAFRLVGNDALLGKVLGEYAVKTLKAKNIVVVDDRTAYGQGLADEFEKAVKTNGGTVSRREFTTDKSTDFTSILTSLKANKPEVLFYGGADAQGAPMVKQMQSLGISAKIMGGDMLNTDQFIELAGGKAAEGHFSAVSGAPIDRQPGGPAFEKKYKQRYKQDVVLFAPQFYDAAYLVAEAMKKANSVEPAKYLPALQKINYAGVTGQFQFDNNGEPKNAPVTIYQVKNGKWTVVAVK
ncbi:branched-chain amino acid ABC transporter substrate-binding protein [Leeia sp. TBRC 13508]|uniref:Branched-chain amino acid ABC transporter substrate-binding protein n=1 Tax=Leeia speluncae TaxID=2884804 RepID=A0ABS8D2E6_9NEIS|nr:branched-chain amino acid ABC transporter substrate-binding protein [Leeia speluncae]MCB6182362.1 branched-chain amino acid ABC transporter substrate-binding protein [Leeia speluncae]